MASQQQIQMLADRYISKIKANPLATKIYVNPEFGVWGKRVELNDAPIEVRTIVTNFTNSLEYDRLVTEFQQQNAGPGESEEVETLAGRYGIPEGLNKTDLLFAVADKDMPYEDRVAIFRERGYPDAIPEQERLDSVYGIDRKLKGMDAWHAANAAGASPEEAVAIFELRGGSPGAFALPASDAGEVNLGDGGGEGSDDDGELGELTDEQLANMVLADIREKPGQFRGSGLLSYKTASGEALAALPQGVQKTVNDFLASSEYYDILAQKNPELFVKDEPDPDVDQVVDSKGQFAATGADAYADPSLANVGGNFAATGADAYATDLGDQSDRPDQDWVDPNPKFAATGADAYATAATTDLGDQSTRPDQDPPGSTGTGTTGGDEFEDESGRRFRTRPGGVVERWDPVTGEWILFGDTDRSEEGSEGGEGVVGISDFMGDTPAESPGGYTIPTADEIDSALALGEMPDEEPGGPWGGESVWTDDRVDTLIEHYGAKAKQDFGDQVAEMDEYYNARGLSWSGARQDALGRAVEDFSEHYTENIVNPIMLKAMENIEASEQTRWTNEFNARVTEAELTGQYQRRPFDLNELAGIDNTSFLTEDGKLDHEVYEANVGSIIEQYRAVVGRNPTSAELTKLIRGGEVSPFGPTLGQQEFKLREAATTGYYKNAPVLEFLLQNDAQDHEAMLMAGFTFTDPTTGETKRVLGVDERADKEFLRESDILNGYWAPTVRYDADGNREVVYETVTAPNGEQHRIPVMNRIWGSAELDGFVENEKLRLTKEGMDDEDARYYADLEWKKMQRNGYSTTIEDPMGRPHQVWIEGDVGLEQSQMSLKKELMELQLDHDTAERLATEDYNEKVRRGYWMTDGYGHPIYIHGAQDHDLRVQRIQNEFNLSRDEAEREWRRQERVGYSEVFTHPGPDGIDGTDDDVYLGTRHVQGTQGWNTWEANRKDQLVRDGWDEESAAGVANWERTEKSRGGYWMADENVPGGQRWVRGTEAHEARIQTMRDDLVRDGWVAEDALQTARHVHQATMEKERQAHEKWIKTRVEWFKVRYLLPHDEAMAQAEREWKASENVRERSHDLWRDFILRQHQRKLATTEQEWRAAETELDRIHDKWMTTRVEWFKVNYGHSHDEAMLAAEQEWRAGEAVLDRASQEKMNTEDLQEARALREAKFKSDMILATIGAIGKIATESVLGDGDDIITRVLRKLGLVGDDKDDKDGSNTGWSKTDTLLTATALKKLLDPGDKSGLGDEFWQSLADEMNVLRNGKTEETVVPELPEDQTGQGGVDTTEEDGVGEKGSSDRAGESDDFEKKEAEVDERTSSGEGTGEPDPDGVTNEPIEIEWDRIDFMQMFKGFVDGVIQTGMSRQVGYEYWAAQNPGWDQAVGATELGLTIYNGFQAGGPAGAVSAYVGWVAANVTMAQFGERRADTHAQMDMSYDEAARQMSPEMLGIIRGGRISSRAQFGRWSMEIDMANGVVQWRPDESGSVGQSYKEFREPIAEWSARNNMLVLPTQKDVLQKFAKDGNAYQKNFYNKWYQELNKRKIFDGVGSGEDGKVKWAFVSPDGVVSYYNFVGERLGGFDLNDEAGTGELPTLSNAEYDWGDGEKPTHENGNVRSPTADEMARLPERLRTIAAEALNHTSVVENTDLIRVEYPDGRVVYGLESEFDPHTGLFGDLRKEKLDILDGGIYVEFEAGGKATTQGLGEEDDDVMHTDQGTERTS